MPKVYIIGLHKSSNKDKYKIDFSRYLDEIGYNDHEYKMLKDIRLDDVSNTIYVKLLDNSEINGSSLLRFKTSVQNNKKAKNYLTFANKISIILDNFNDDKLNELINEISSYKYSELFNNMLNIYLAKYENNDSKLKQYKYHMKLIYQSNLDGYKNHIFKFNFPSYIPVNLRALALQIYSLQIEMSIILNNAKKEHNEIKNTDENYQEHSLTLNNTIKWIEPFYNKIYDTTTNISNIDPTISNLDECIKSIYNDIHKVCLDNMIKYNKI